MLETEVWCKLFFNLNENAESAVCYEVTISKKSYSSLESII